MTMSKTYIPTRLREPVSTPREERWGIGIEKEEGVFGMTDGPLAEEVEGLEIIGERGSKIIHFKVDGIDEVVWRWSVNRDCWVKLKHGKIL